MPSTEMPSRPESNWGTDDVLGPQVRFNVRQFISTASNNLETWQAIQTRNQRGMCRNVSFIIFSIIVLHT